MNKIVILVNGIDVTNNISALPLPIDATTVLEHIPYMPDFDITPRIGLEQKSVQQDRSKPN